MSRDQRNPGSARASSSSPVEGQPGGADEIRTMLRSGGLERATPDDRLAQMQLDQARDALDLASQQVDERPEVALTVAYDAGRKAVVAMLEAQGLRAKMPNAHVNVQDALAAQWGQLLADEFDAVRKARHRVEYPNPSTSRTSAKSAQRAVRVAEGLLRLAEDQMPRLIPFDR